MRLILEKSFDGRSGRVCVADRAGLTACVPEAELEKLFGLCIRLWK